MPAVTGVGFKIKACLRCSYRIDIQASAAQEIGFYCQCSRIVNILKVAKYPLNTIFMIIVVLPVRNQVFQQTIMGDFPPPVAHRDGGPVWLVGYWAI